MNQPSTEGGLEPGEVATLGCSSPSRLLVELSAWLAPDELQTIDSADMSRAGPGRAGGVLGCRCDVRVDGLPRNLGRKNAPSRVRALLSAEVTDD
jgi:hypothetical protein